MKPSVKAGLLGLGNIVLAFASFVTGKESWGVRPLRRRCRADRCFHDLRGGGEAMSMHVSPTNDLIEHDLTDDECVCVPDSRPVKREDESIGWVIVHRSLDGRENHEKEPNA